MLKIRRVGCTKELNDVTSVSLESKNLESLHVPGFEQCLNDKKSRLCQVG